MIQIILLYLGVLLLWLASVKITVPPMTDNVIASFIALGIITLIGLYLAIFGRVEKKRK